MRRALALVAVATLSAAGVGTGQAAGRAAGTLELHAAFSVKWKEVACPAGTQATTWCYSNLGSAVVPGLGNATEEYVLLVEHADTDCADWRFTAVVTVAGKGSITADASTPNCFSPFEQDARPNYTITGGSGAYAGATGSGTMASTGTETGPGQGVGLDRWAGTLLVPGLEFDVTAPVFARAVNLTVRSAKGARRAVVRYTVTASDDVDGPVPVTCKPKSGSRFTIGKTTVTCSSTDKSGNTATTRFIISVRRR